MLPEICRIGSFTIYSYGLMLVLAFFAVAVLSFRQAKKEKFEPDKIFNLCFVVFLSGIVGSRVLYVLDNLYFYLCHPLEIIMLQHGGLAWFGGLIFGAISAVVFVKKNKMDLLRSLDLLAPFVALGQAIGRIGCLLNGCCYGGESRFGIYFKVFDKILIPTQLYSSLLLIFIFFILRFKQNRNHLPGEIIASYFFLYAIKRFFMEFLRQDSPRIFYGLTFFQILCLVLFLFSLGMFAKIFGAKKR